MACPKSKYVSLYHQPLFKTRSSIGYYTSLGENIGVTFLGKSSLVLFQNPIFSKTADFGQKLQLLTETMFLTENCSFQQIPHFCLSLKQDSVMMCLEQSQLIERSQLLDNS